MYCLMLVNLSALYYINWILLRKNLIDNRVRFRKMIFAYDIFIELIIFKYNL